MIKVIVLIFSVSSLLFALQINEKKEGEVYDWYMKGDRKVITPHNKPLISVYKKPVIPVYKEPQKDESKDQLSTEEVKKQFASKETLNKSESTAKEEINTKEEAAQFFESINKKDIKPVNIEK